MLLSLDRWSKIDQHRKGQQEWIHLTPYYKSSYGKLSIFDIDKDRQRDYFIN